MAYSVSVCRPLWEADPPVQSVVLAGEALGTVSFSTTLQGGYAEASVELTSRAGDLAIPGGAHVAVAWNGATCFEGMFRTPRSRAGRLAGFDVTGYAQALLDVNPWQTAGFATDLEPRVPMALILAEVLGQAEPMVKVGQPWGEPSGDITRSELDLRSPWQIVDQICSGTGYDFTVYEGRVARFVARLGPETDQDADLMADFAQLAQYEEDQLDTFTRIVATYTPPSGGTRQSTREFADYAAEKALGAKRLVVKDAGTCSLPYAEAWAQVQLRDGPVPTVRANIGPLALLRTPWGGGVPGPFVRAGQWLAVPGRGRYCIVGTSVDERGMVTAQLAERPLTPAANLALARQVAQAYSRRTSLTTGGPA